MKKIVMLTAWDFPTAKILDKANIDYILVGDSLAMTILGHTDTKKIGMEEMLHHTKAVAMGSKHTPVIADMPIGSYKNPKLAVENAKKFVKAGARLVKIEGDKPDVVQALVRNKIKVVGHLGLLPQSAKKYRVAGKEFEEAEKIAASAIALERFGISLLVLECIPESLAKKITKTIKTPTIGIGAGKFTTGQVLVLADIIGLSGKQLKMAKQYVDVAETIAKAVTGFKKDVETGKFPTKENSFL